MVRFELLKDIGVLVIEPMGALSADDFREAARVVVPYIHDNGKLTGLLIEAASFPGWDSFGALVQHMKFTGITTATSIAWPWSPTACSCKSLPG